MQDTPELLNTTLSQGARRVQWGSPCTSGAWARVYVDGVLYDFVSDGIIAIARSAMINAVGNELPTFGPALPVERQVCPREVAVIERNEGGAIIRIKKNFRYALFPVVIARRHAQRLGFYFSRPATALRKLFVFTQRVIGLKVIHICIIIVLSSQILIILKLISFGPRSDMFVFLPASTGTVSCRSEAARARVTALLTVGWISRLSLQ